MERFFIVDPQDDEALAHGFKKWEDISVYLTNFESVSDDRVLYGNLRLTENSVIEVETLKFWEDHGQPPQNKTFAVYYDPNSCFGRFRTDLTEADIMERYEFETRNRYVVSIPGHFRGILNADPDARINWVNVRIAGYGNRKIPVEKWDFAGADKTGLVMSGCDKLFGSFVISS